MKNIVVIFDSRYGHTAQMATAVAAGACRLPEVESHTINIKDVSRDWKRLSAADAMIFGSPTYFGGVSAAFKEFMEKSSIFYAEQRWKDKLAAGFTCSGGASGDKLATLQQISIFAAQHGMHWVNLGIGKAGTTHDVESEENLNRLGCWIGAAGQSNGSAAVASSDLATARYLGQRVAETVMRFV